MSPHRPRSWLGRIVTLLAGFAAVSGLAAAATVDVAVPVVVLDPGDAGPPDSRWWQFREEPPSAGLTRVETQPAGAELELILIRDEVGRAHEWRKSPVAVQLPSRRKGDVLLVRARLEGHRTREVSLHALEVPDRLEIPLEPLPNALRALTHIDLVGRRLLLLWTDEPARIRFRTGGASAHLVLSETRNLVRAVPGIRLDVVAEDLFVEVPLTAGWQDEAELRAHQSRDSARGLERTTVEWVPHDGGLEAIDRARAGLAALGSEHANTCARAFDAALREKLPAEALARALAPTGRFVDAVHAAAVRRLAEVAPGRSLELLDGVQLDPRKPAEADHALGRLAEIRGYLGWLRSFVWEVAPTRKAPGVLAALIAPALSAEEFAAALEHASAAEVGCRERSADAGSALR